MATPLAATCEYVPLALIVSPRIKFQLKHKLAPVPFCLREHQWDSLRMSSLSFVIED